MTNKETVERNIGLTFDFVEYLIDNPDVIEALPENFILEFVENDFPKIEKKEEEGSKSLLIKKYVKVRNSFELIT